MSKKWEAVSVNPLAVVWEAVSGRQIVGMQVTKRGYANRLEGVRFLLDNGNALDVAVVNMGDAYDPVGELSLLVVTPESQERWTI